VIVVVGRPGIAAPSLPGPGDDVAAQPAGLVAAIATAAAKAGARVEVVGTIGDDPEGDALTVALARAGVGHAALLRDPAARTVRPDVPREDWPRLEPPDVELGLRYHSEYRVLILGEHLDADVERVALEAASFQSAAVIAIVRAGAEVRDELANAGTVLEPPEEGKQPFAELVGLYAAALDRGEEPGEAFAGARLGAGWERPEAV
jgi:hypothetical protein